MSNPYFNLQSPSDQLGLYSDSRSHGHQGPTRNVYLYRATPSGGGVISRSEDGLRCASAGKESLRIIQITDGSRPLTAGQKSSVGRGGYRIDASRNFWDGSGLKMDCASTDVAWARGVFNNKILTSARNGEVIMWDVNKSGTGKYERRSKDHIRSINAMSVSNIVHHYCITGSADGDMRVWDLREMSRSLIRVHHPTSVRSLAFSPSTWQPLHAIVGLDNGSIYRWDLKMGQRGLLDRLSVAHTASVTSLDWCNQVSPNLTGQSSASLGGALEGPGGGLGWLVSGGLDRLIKVWDLTVPGLNTRIPNKPTYILHPSFPVRRVVWRPSYECELAVVSNADFSTGSNADLSQTGSNGASGLEKALGSASAGADAVEIWDVRRSWIPKWSVAGTAAEGSVTDITFGDANAIWSQHSSGTFSQIDLRNCTKPLDSIATTAATWDASGSLTFVVDTESSWQVPYDDISREKRNLAEKHHVKPKMLGDASYRPFSQDLGTLGNDDEHKLDIFKCLARGYVIHGKDRPKLCAVNARVAYEAAQESLAQTWLLLGASLTDLVPSSESKSSQQSNSIQSSQIPSSILPSATAHLNYAFPSSVSSPARLRKTSPSQIVPGMQPRSSSASASRRMTPASSNASSPRQIPSPLPSNSSVTPRRPSFLTSRDFSEADFARRPSISLYRRPSLSTPGSHSISPVAERTASGTGGGGASLRHVGEGALDDSDSSSPSGGSAGGDAESGQDDGVTPAASSLISPLLLPNRGITAPSPLSRVAGQHRWSEEETQERHSKGTNGDDDDDWEEGSSSPSPRSTDTESVGSGSPSRQSKAATLSRPTSRRRHSLKLKSRSRSSTVASLAAGSTVGGGARILLPPPLVHQDSQSSIRTVTAGEVTFLDPGSRDSSVQVAGGVKPEETLRDVRDSHHDRRQSIAPSEMGLNRASPLEVDGEDVDGGDPGKPPPDVDTTTLTDRRIELVGADEKRFRDLAWVALREAFGMFADEGDVQTCTMLAIIASEELRIPKSRVTRFLESYIELLTRQRLHACAAYLRKHCEIDPVRHVTLLETTIYTSCGQCRKPFVVAAGSSASQLIKGSYAFCRLCRKSPIICAICRLPVRTLFFQCTVCKHGGHQACYRDYYGHGPSIETCTSGVACPARLDATSLGVPDTSLGAPRTSRRHLSTGPDDDTGYPATRSGINSALDLSSDGLGPLIGSAHASSSPEQQLAAAASTAYPSVERMSRLLGYPCATGCGHICWASNANLENSSEAAEEG